MANRMPIILNPAAPILTGSGMFALVLLQSAIPQIPDPSWVGQIEHLSLTGAMAIVIVVLWRAFQAKDSALTKNTEVMTAALSASTASNIELRKIIEESVSVNNRLTFSIDRLAAIHENGDEPPHHVRQITR